MAAQVAINNRIIKINFADNMVVLVHEGLQADLLQIFHQYPHIEFTSRIMASNLENARLPDIEEALESLVNINLVAKYSGHGSPFYSLTTRL